MTFYSLLPTMPAHELILLSQELMKLSHEQNNSSPEQIK
jgi:hypothetical protein